MVQDGPHDKVGEPSRCKGEKGIEEGKVTFLSEHSGVLGTPFLLVYCLVLSRS